MIKFVKNDVLKIFPDSFFFTIADHSIFLHHLIHQPFSNRRYLFFIPNVCICADVIISYSFLNVLNNNYPDKPITGRQKNVFNWLFLLNFLLVAFLFGVLFAEYRELHPIANLIDRSVSLCCFNY